MQTRKKFGAAEHDIPAVTMYQMNLILDDPAEQRLNVLTTTLQTARSNARIAADFLDVPVLDTVVARLQRAGVRPCGRGGRRAASAAASMPADWAWLIVSPTAAEAGPDVLIIRPHRLAFLYGVQGKVLASLATTTLLVVTVVVETVPAWFAVTFAACVVVYLLMLLKAMGRQARFDRERGTLTLRRVGRGKPLGRLATLPLASVKAVEVAKVGYRRRLLPVEPSARRPAATATQPQHGRGRRGGAAGGGACGVLPRRTAAGRVSAGDGPTRRRRQATRWSC